MNGYKIVLLKAILCFIGCRKVNGYAPEYVLDKGDLFKLYKVSTIPRWFLLDSDNVCIADGRAEDGLVKKIQDELGL